jgi:hypothetical protein
MKSKINIRCLIRVGEEVFDIEDRYSVVFRVSNVTDTDMETKKEGTNFDSEPLFVGQHIISSVNTNRK